MKSREKILMQKITKREKMKKKLKNKEQENEFQGKKSLHFFHIFLKK